MNENCANAGNFGGLDSSEYRILQKSRTDSPPLELEINSKPPNHHHGDGVGHIPPHTARNIPVRGRARGQRVVAHNLAADANDIGP